MSQLEQEVREARTLPPVGLRRPIREAAGVAQRRLAEEVGVSRMTLYRWESGAREPRGRLRAIYARVLRELEDATR